MGLEISRFVCVSVQRLEILSDVCIEAHLHMNYTVQSILGAYWDFFLSNRLIFLSCTSKLG